jgi:hypothetical protein
MTAFATRVQAGTAACVIAAAAVLTPAAVAHADPVAPLPIASLGAGVVAPVCDPEASANCDAIVSPFAIPSGDSSNAALRPILQNPLWWFGIPNPTPPASTTVFTFYPLALLPGFIRPFFGWFNDINFEACVGGLRLHVGPYGTITGSYSRGCA